MKNLPKTGSNVNYEFEKIEPKFESFILKIRMESRSDVLALLRYMNEGSKNTLPDLRSAQVENLIDNLTELIEEK